MASSLSEVARRASVSLGTASSVLTGRKGHRVASATAARIRKAADELGYKPNRLARALATGKTRLIALIDYEFGAAYSNRLARQFHRVLAEDDHDLVVFGESTDPSAVASLADGAFCTSRIVPAELDKILPLVQISPKPDTRQDSLRLDMRSSAEEAMKAFGQVGCERIGCIGKVSSLDPLDPRLVAYRSFISETRRPEILIDVPADCPSNDFLTLREYVGSNRWPHGLFCLNDEIASGTYRAIREAGLKVGSDVAVIGCDDIDADYFDPPLTTQSIPFEEIGRIAWSLLRERIQSPDIPARVIDVTPKLVMRQSHLYTPGTP
jgi:LacI family transcriptional regulator